MMKREVIVWLVCASAVSAQDGPYSWGELFDGGRPGRIALDDIDGDGDLDVVSLLDDTQVSQNRLQAYLGDGAGVFVRESAVNLSGFTSRTTFAVGDVDGDGASDVVVTRATATRLYPGNGLGSFSTGATLSTGAGLDVGFIDADGDGDLDLLVLEDGATSSIEFYRNDAGELIAESVMSVADARALLVADIDGDGDDDFLTVGPATLASWLGDGLGGFSSGTATTLSSLPPASADASYSLAASDLDGDGDSDVAVVASDSNAGVFYALGGDGAGGFSVSEERSLVAFSCDVALDDVNSDGFLDALHVWPGNGKGLGLLTGGGDGTFTNSDLTSVSNKAVQHLANADVDGDGLIETLVSVNSRDLAVLHIGDDALFNRASQKASQLVSSQVLVDMNGDGFDDILEARSAPDRDVRVRLSTGSGTDFAPPETVIFGPQALALAAGDLDQNGAPDVVFRTDTALEGMWSLMNDGAGGYATIEAVQPAPGMTTILGPFVIDVNGDGRADRLLVNRPFFGDPIDAIVTLSDIDGTALTTITSIASSTFGLGVGAAGDVNGDGILDLTFTHIAFGTQVIEVALGNGDGSFTPGPSSPYSTNFDGRIAELLDVDIDGDLDIVMYGGDRAIFENDGTGHFVQRDVQLALLSGAARPGVFTDVDGDGTPDLVAAEDGALSQFASALYVTRLNPNMTFEATRRFVTFSDGVEFLAVGDLDKLGGRDLVFWANDGRRQIWAAKGERRWADRGRALTGAHATMRLAGTGELLPGTDGAYALSQGVPGETVFLVLGLSELDAPFKGGALVPTPQFVIPLPLVGTGSAVIPFLWPAGVPSGVEITTQVWASDVNAIAGFTASNALTATVP